MMTLDEWIRRQGVTREHVAREIGVSVVSVCRYVNGARVPRRGVIAKIKALTGDAVTADSFMRGETDRAA